MQQDGRAEPDGVHLSEPGNHRQRGSDLAGRELHCSSHNAANISAKFVGKTHGFVLRAGQKYNGLARNLILPQLLHRLLRAFRRIENTDGYFHSALPSELNARLGILRKSEARVRALLNRRKFDWRTLLPKIMGGVSTAADFYPAIRVA